jgi:hypothetical protein
MARRREQPVRVRDLDDAAHVHHGDPVAHVLDDRQVMGHEQVREPELALEIEHQVQYLRLHGDVEGRDRLVRDHEARVERERPGDADALPLPAAERVREAPHVLGSKADQAQKLGDAIPALAPVADVVHEERLAHDVEQRLPGIERREGVLEDHLHLAPEWPQASPGQGGDVDHLPVPAPEEDLARGGRDRAQDAAGCRRLAAAALADEGERLSPPEIEAHVVHRPDVADEPPQEAPPDREKLPETSNVEEETVGRGGRVEAMGPVRPADRRRHARDRFAHAPARAPAGIAPEARGGWCRKQLTAIRSSPSTGRRSGS